MANNFDSNFTRRLARIFLKQFETKRVMTKNVDTQLLANVFNPASGTIVDFKRPTDYKSVRTPKGVLSATDISNIITGKASGVVQDYFTVYVEFDEFDQSLKMDQLEKLLDPMSTRMVVDLELDFAEFMMRNSALVAGTVGTPVSEWSDVALAGATMKAFGIPRDGMWNYALNPFGEVTLADKQTQLGGGAAGMLAKSAWEQAIIKKNFAGMDVMEATALGSYTTDGTADREGAVDVAPTQTYLSVKDSMIQTIHVDGITADTVIKAGEKMTITGPNHLNLSTRKVILDASGNAIPFQCTVVEDVTFTSGEADVLVTGPGIFETDTGNGAFNTIDKLIGDGNVVTFGIQSSSDVTVQPNLFWHKQAFALGSVNLQKLFATDTLATTKDGIRIRVTKFADGLENKQIIRFDMLPAYGVMNPFFAGQGFGV